MKYRALFFLLALAAFISAFQTPAYCQDIDGQSQADIVDPVYYRGKVTETLEVVERSYDYAGLTSTVQLLRVLALEGSFKGETLSAEYALNYALDGKYKAALLPVGAEVFFMLAENEPGAEEIIVYVTELARDKYLLYLVMGFILLLLLVGRSKGLKAVVSLALTVLAIFKILLPSILNGWNPILMSVLICVGITVITLLIISGWNTKTLSAILGTSGGVIVAGIIALVMGSLADLTGLGSNEAQMLMYIPQDIYFDFRGLLFSGILIGAMGATMDVGMSIASAMYEIKQNSPDIEAAELIKAGMNVGRDAMATMANTLILAYVGGSMQLILLFMAYNYALSMLINWDMIASEIVRALAGSIGIIIAIPITAVSSAFIQKFLPSGIDEKIL